MSEEKPNTGKKEKSILAGVVLCLLFSVFGLLYVSVKLGVIVSIAFIVIAGLASVLLGIQLDQFFLLFNIAAAIYAYVAIKKHNESLSSGQAQPTTEQPPQTPPEQTQSQ